MTRTHLRPFALAAAAIAGSLVLAGCSGTGASDPDAPVTLRIVWWGDDARTSVTNDAIDAFEAEHENITVETEALPFDGYYDRLSTQVAANDAPDVQQITADFVVEYGSRGALLDLDDVPTDALDEATTRAATIDGELLGVPTGVSTHAIVANPVLFEQAGVEMPDDSTWTWEDYAETAEAISDGSPDGVFGTGALGTDVGQVNSWARQSGSQMFDEDGELQLSEESMTEFFELSKRLVDSGAAPNADAASEETALAIEQSGTATNRYAMGFWQTSQLSSLEAVSQSGLELLRLPSMDGTVGGAQMGFGASQYWVASSRSEHPAEAQELIDYLANSTDAGKSLLVSRGSPANSEVRDAVVPLLSESDARITTFVSDITPEVADNPLFPPGASSMQDNLRRYTSAVLFGLQSPSEAAAGFLGETAQSVQQ